MKKPVNLDLILTLSVVIGLIIGVFYTLISNAFQPHKMAKKTLTD